jgi:hypothetical protein
MLDTSNYTETINGVKYTVLYRFNPLNIIQRVKVLKITPKKCPLSVFQLAVRINESLLKPVI